MQPSQNFNRSRTSIGRLSRSAISHVTGRITRLLGGAVSLQNAGRFLRRQLWAWPIIAALLLGVSGWWVNRSVEEAMRGQRQAELTTIVNASVAALEIWITDQKRTAELFAVDEQLRSSVNELLALADGATPMEGSLLQAKAQGAIRSRLADRLQHGGYTGFLIVSPGEVVLASDQNGLVGKPVTSNRKELFNRAFAGHAEVSKPFRSRLWLADENGELQLNLPTMLAAAPILDDKGKPLAVLGLRIRPDDEFTRILRVASSGKTGETYAFDRNGLFLSQSRFDENLKEIGLLPNVPDSHSILTLQVHDPQVNLVSGQRTATPRSKQPLTKMAAEAVTGKDGCNADGYRDYRGVPVVGAWRWLPDYDMGVATEIDVKEAFGPEHILRRGFWCLMVLLALSAVGIFFAMLFIERQQRALQKATLAAKKLGQYTLEEKLGVGGMGTVYKARHAMLQRPTAVKLLDVDKMSAAAVARFEREVQLTSGLTHPNTVAIFDYGRTPEGIFYYAMEYLEGTNLDDLVARFGPLPEARIVFLLRQICGSLSEAHTGGLVHRDIKPANIFLTRRGGLHDFVKVLDFGLVKVQEGGDDTHLTSPNAVTGTPLYMAPEAVNQPERVDARSDVYAIGAVGYFLLTGSPVFTGASVMEICLKHVQAAPESPSARAGKAVHPQLESLILRCLMKSQSDRPADAAALLRELEACFVGGRWTREEAAVWWQAQGSLAEMPAKAPSSEIVQGTERGKATPEVTVVYEKR
jgi:eukaryotic-like serine/threonine-protein kinase